MKDDDCFVELFKLQKMFESSFHITCPESNNSIEDVYDKDTLSFDILFKPTDPDFDASILPTSEGIKIHLNLYRICPTDSTNQSTINDQLPTNNTISDHSNPLEDKMKTQYILKDIKDVSITDPSLTDIFKMSIQKVLLDYVTRNSKQMKYVVYESLKFLDKNFVQLYNLTQSIKRNENKSKVIQHESSPEKVNYLQQKHTKTQNQDNPWTLEEQKCLEDGLVRFKGINDPLEKWSLISKLVKTRSPEACRRRFLRCREVLVKKNKPAETKESDQPIPSLDKTGPLSFTRVEMNKISLGKIGTFSIEIMCLRCNYRFEVTLMDLGEKTTIYSKSCEKCNTSIRCEFTPSLFFQTELTFGRLSLLNSDFIDFNLAEFKLTCEDCETQSKIREVKIGDKKSFNCRGCFSKFLFSFDTIEFGQRQEPSNEILVKKVVKHETKKPLQPKGIKVGTPLPANGTCKHYKKSFRWFRFPCCGRLFPCDICHDDISDHKCGYANFIVCGYCSTQQPSSNKVCKFCSKGCTAASSSHWEGGKGCRDGTKLSRKDSKKYKLINKNNVKK